MVQFVSSPEPSEQINSRINPCLIRLAYPLGCYVVMPLFFGRIEVIGRENVPQTGPVLVAPTHRSRWDALIVPYAIGRLASGRDLRFMVTIDEYHRPVQGWFIRQLGGFPIDTKRPGISSLHHSVELLRAGEMLVIFPEGAPGGKIYRGEKVHPIKRGVARIALEVELAQPGSGIKILPIAIKYSQPYPSWGSNVAVTIGEPIDVVDYSSASIKKSSQALTNALESALRELYEGTSQAIPMATA
ncbi:MAG: 1-acyl-sn-glycerol-3-phosphate acyltransferase [Hydrococcus sp. C42_A2020_068]|uniref:lysophospholipid acyltransferase family protein n=1 Tax=Pleurocapsa sp. PCC 7327 TaxID=118163 RepID=UPI00029FDEA0|nr:lysophospholipid acyltransferase family protein [Pleurocapsa sp. PCC 7327]AFY76665.1 1-acyl-sn-glycerol-3-phosphate acyltransferase [Pleurocapsa sp. PCC 7327]MBF2021589.1 1-acyl-sn-glycerol-3-phosphate acyltransferase [Hydrococcus sp. C42_A2020_068]